MKEADVKVKKMIEIAVSLLGKSYKYGAKPEEAPEVFDCSSFTQYVFKQVGVELPRSAILQAAEGTEVKREETEAGDLIFMHGTVGHYNEKFPLGIGHVVLNIGGGEIIHGSSKSGVVLETLPEALINREPLVTIKRYV